MYVYASFVIYRRKEISMAKIIPDLLIGAFYGFWEVLEELPRQREKYYLCKCECGFIKEVSKSSLRLGKSLSCGKGKCKVFNGTHGMTDTPLYGVWCSIKYRLKNPLGANTCYAGVALDPTWETFEPFRDWSLSHGYIENLTIDRIDSTKGYTPSNCRWVDCVVQSQNRRKHSSKQLDLPKGVFKSKPRNTEIKYKGTAKAPYYWITSYRGKRHQGWGFSSPEEAYQDKCRFIKENFDGLIYPD